MLQTSYLSMYVSISMSLCMAYEIVKLNLYSRLSHCITGLCPYFLFPSWGIRDRKGSHWSWGFWCFSKTIYRFFHHVCRFSVTQFIQCEFFFQSHWFSVWTFCHSFGLERRGLMEGARWLWFAYLHSLIMKQCQPCGPKVCSDPDHIAITYSLLETPKQQVSAVVLSHKTGLD